MSTINAFHPDYMKTYHPDLLSSVRLESTQHANGVINGAKSKATRENKHGNTVNSINVFPKTKPKTTVKERTEKILAVTNFYMFSKAGTANTTKTKKAK